MKGSLRTFIKLEPLHVYAISCRLLLEEDARLAARQWSELCPRTDENVVDKAKGEVLDWEKTIAGASYIQEMADMSAGVFYRLIQFVRTGKEMLFCILHNAEVDSEAASSDNTPGARPSETSSEAAILIDNAGGTTASLDNSIVDLPAAIHDARTRDATSSSANAAESKDSEDDNTITVSDEFNFPDYDLTVLSSDGVEFRLHEIILRLGSSKLVQNVTVNDHGNKCLSLSEDSNTLSKLFEICYPIANVDLSDISLAFRLMFAAHKYEMTKAIDIIREILKAQMHVNPLVAYFALAGNGFLEDAAEIVQNALFKQPVEEMYVPEMEDIPAQLYYHLLEYRHQCLTAIDNVCTKYEGDLVPKSNVQWWDVAVPHKNIVPTIRSRSLSGPVAEMGLRKLQEEARKHYTNYHQKIQYGTPTNEDIIKVAPFTYDELYQKSQKLEEVNLELSKIEIKTSCTSLYKISPAAFPEQNNNGTNV
ncbi:hypothetical protein BDQ17DRAFT_1413510 [Cyathus striatus]|nr:hypothetical protein BDQ17DRAFT_1413510 [Cyathus striatus]